MQRWIPVLIITALLSGQWLHTGILLEFLAKRDVIAKTLCMFKDEVENTCQGKCHLNKQLKETEDRKEEIPQLPQEELTLIFCPVAIETGLLLHSSAGDHNSEPPRLHPIRPVSDLLRPPQMG